MPPRAGPFHPLGRVPSEHTVRVLGSARAALPFSDESDLAERGRGVIAAPPEMRIMADAGNVALDMNPFRFLNQKAPSDSVHPSPRRIARLNNNFGLCAVVPGICQTRSRDRANLTSVRGRSGWIRAGPITTTGSARASWELLQTHVGEGLPVSAAIRSRTQIDHLRGVRGAFLQRGGRGVRVRFLFRLRPRGRSRRCRGRCSG